MKIAPLVRNFHRDESGQDLLEYALVLASVLAAVTAGSNSLATLLSSAMGTFNARLQSTVG